MDLLELITIIQITNLALILVLFLVATEPGKEFTKLLMQGPKDDT